ncbi:MAG TPA: pre-peptidase C-terminal domain-containing protein [Burkholderiales bacterium]|nr:pre-peptidase C-terminal domain-containing protein [Burkholderiales bacterium]
MTKHLDTRFAAMAAFLAASMASGAAFAVAENEPNDTIGSAQSLVISGGGAQVTGTLGSGSDVVDFYSFQGQAGDMVTLDIDGGMKSDGTGVDTTIAIFTPDSKILLANDDGGILDLGSVSTLDSYIANLRLPVTGTYTVGVSSAAHFFVDGGGLGSTGFNINLNGSYTLVISGVSDPVVQPAPPPPPAPAPVVQQINIEIKPGNREVAPVNPKSQGSILVALLSNSGFDARGVDTYSLTFGQSGNESSYLRCNKEYRDVDGDGLPDLLCHFDNGKTGFEPTDTAGKIKGRMTAGGQFEGQGWLKVVPAKRK